MNQKEEYDTNDLSLYLAIASSNGEGLVYYFRFIKFSSY